MVNVEALRSELEFITRNPQVWNQGQWWEETRCGTSGCIAGWSVQHSPDWSFHPDFCGDYAVSNHVDEAEAAADEVVMSVRVADVGIAAAEVLGLDSLESKVLFFGGNNLAALWATAEAFTDGLISAPEHIKVQPANGVSFFSARHPATYDEYVQKTKLYLEEKRKRMQPDQDLDRLPRGW